MKEKNDDNQLEHRKKTNQRQSLVEFRFCFTVFAAMTKSYYLHLYLESSITYRPCSRIPQVEMVKGK